MIIRFKKPFKYTNKFYDYIKADVGDIVDDMPPRKIKYCLDNGFIEELSEDEFKFILKEIGEYENYYDNGDNGDNGDNDDNGDNGDNDDNGDDDDDDDKLLDKYPLEDVKYLNHKMAEILWLNNIKTKEDLINAYNDPEILDVLVTLPNITKKVLKRWVDNCGKI